MQNPRPETKFLRELLVTVALQARAPPSPPGALTPVSLSMPSGGYLLNGPSH